MINDFEKLKSYRSFRVPIEEHDKVTFSVDSQTTKEEFEEVKGVCLADVSITGLGFFSGKELDENKLITININFKSLSFSMPSKIMRTQVIYNDYGEQEKVFYGVSFLNEDQEKQKNFLSKFISGFSAKRLKGHITSLLLNDNQVAEYSIREKVHMLLSLYLDMGRFGKADSFLELIFLETARIIEAERTNLWLLCDSKTKLALYDWKNKELGEVNFSYKDSVVEGVVLRGEIIKQRIKSVRDDDSFYSQLTKEYQIETRSVLLAPIINGVGHIVGMVEFANKVGEESFESHDEMNLKVLTSVVTASFADLEVAPEVDSVLHDFSEVTQKYKIVGKSKSVIKMKEFINRNKHTKNNILIHGEAGAGKLHLAQILHYQGDGGQMSCGNINCFDYVNSNSLSSDLYGDDEHVGKLELYSGGSIIVEDISNLSLIDQQVLIDSFTDRPDIRIIATSLCDLTELVEKGLFIEELRAFVAKKQFEVQPLRKRKEDIVELVNHYLKDECRKNGYITKRLSSNIQDKFLNYDWPGNVEELKTAIQRLVLYYPNSHVIKQCGNDVVPIFDVFHSQLETFSNLLIKDMNDFSHYDLDKFMILYKGQYIYKVLSMYHNDIDVVSKTLQMTRMEVDSILESFDVTLKEFGVEKVDALKEVS